MRVVLLHNHALQPEKCGGDISEACQHNVSKANRKEYGSLRRQYSGKEHQSWSRGTNSRPWGVVWDFKTISYEVESQPSSLSSWREIY